MSKTPKKIIPKPLSNQERNEYAYKMARALNQVWDKAPNPNYNYIDDYIIDLEDIVYQYYYLLGSFDAYRSKCTDLIFNLRHNGQNLFAQYNPKQLSNLTSQELSQGYLSGNANVNVDVKIDSNVKAEVKAKIKTKSRVKSLPPQQQQQLHQQSCYYPIAVAKQEAAKKQATATSLINDPQEAQRIIDAEKKKFNDQLKTDSGEQMNTKSQILCPRCKEYTVTYFTKQTRSADEPMTLICTCNNLKCKHRFNIYP